MSIHIGLVPNTQKSSDVFTIYSSKSNLMRIQSELNNTVIDIGDYNLGQNSNEQFEFSYKNSNIIMTFDSNVISLNRNIVATSNLYINGSLNISSNINTLLGVVCGNLNTSNIKIQNTQSNGYKFIDCRSNEISTLYLTNEDNGVGYIGGRLGIGVTSSDKNYSLITSSNIFVNGNVRGKAIVADKIVVNSNQLNGSIYFNNSNELIIDAPKVIINNFGLGGKTDFTNIRATEVADFSGLLLASNISIYNNNILKNPFKINQRLISNQYGNSTLGNPISVKSEHININIDPTILELSSCGNLVLGDYPSLSNISTNYTIIKDYVVRGYIPTNREQHFKGYLSFSSNGSEKTLFNVDKSGQVSIGSSKPEALMDIVNGFTSYENNYVKPSSILYLRNNNTSNELPFLKCGNSNSIKFQITSNATICFNETPVNMYKYNIESGNSYLSNIDTCKISSYNSNGIIDMSYSIMSNIGSIYSDNIFSSKLNSSNLYSSNINVTNCFIQNLQVGSFRTAGSSSQSDTSIFSIGNDHLSVSGKNIFISKNTTLTNLPSYVNKYTDKLVIETETAGANANGYTIFGNNTSIKLFCKNESTAVNSFVAQELRTSTGGFAFVSKITYAGAAPELYITPIVTSTDPYEYPSLTIYNNKTIGIGFNLFVQITSTIVDSLIGTNSSKSANIGNGINVFAKSTTDSSNRFACLTTNKYGSIDTGRGSIHGFGPFNKQGGWVTTTSGVYIILNDDYSVRANSSGTLHIQIQGVTGQLGNATVSFLRPSGTSEIFTISRHKSASLVVFTIAAVASGIQITTDVNCKVCWTSIGSC